MSLNAICIVFVVVEHIKDELVETHELEQEAGAGWLENSQRATQSLRIIGVNRRLMLVTFDDQNLMWMLSHCCLWAFYMNHSLVYTSHKCWCLRMNETSSIKAYKFWLWIVEISILSNEDPDLSKENATDIGQVLKPTHGTFVTFNWVREVSCAQIAGSFVEF